MYAVVEFVNFDGSTSVELVHKEWFTDQKLDTVRCPPNNWYKTAKNWKDSRMSTFKWKINKCQVLTNNIGNECY